MSFDENPKVEMFSCFLLLIVSSIPSKAPPKMKRIFEVSILIYS